MSNKQDQVILCGYGATASNKERIFNKYNIVAYAFSDQATINKDYLKKNIPVINISNIKQIYSDYIIICSSIKSSIELLDILVNNDISKDQIRFLLNNDIVSYETWLIQKTLFSLEEKILSLKEDVLKFENNIDRIAKKLSLKDNVFRIGRTKFYVPNYPIDFIQKHIVDTNSFFEYDILQCLDNIIPINAVIFDIGANIGNHSLYWANNLSVKTIYAFEPVKDTYEILSKNIVINNLTNIFAFNIGFSDKKTNASEINFRIQNIGATHLQHDDNGSYKLITVDSFVEENHITKLDFMKIDVEDMELNVLRGASRTLENLSPIIFLESYDDYLSDVKFFLEHRKYSLIRNYPHHNYLFMKVT